MISLEDCIGLCGLDQSAVLAIAEHEHIPEIVAAGLADYLAHSSRGLETVRNMIIDDIRDAGARGDGQHMKHLLLCLQQFLAVHPELAIEAQAQRH